MQAVVLPLIGLGQGGQQPLGEGRGLAHIPGARASELVPAKARGGVAGTEQAGDALGHLGQQQIPGVVAVGIVDDLEAVGSRNSRERSCAGCAGTPWMRCSRRSANSSRFGSQVGLSWSASEQLVVGLMQGGGEPGGVGIQHG